MWFEALRWDGRHPPTQWFTSFLKRLLEGSPEVLALLEHNPFPDRPPRFLRTRVYQYTFTDRETKQDSGAWWQREYEGLYIPIEAISLQNFSR